MLGHVRTLYKDLLYKLPSRTFWSQQPVFVVIWSDYSEDSWRFLETIRRLRTWSEAFRPFSKMTRWFPKITESIFTVYYETVFHKKSSLTFVAFWCRVSTACVPSTQFFSLKYFGSWGLISNVPVAPLNGHFPWDIWVTGQVFCSLVSGSRSPLRNEDAVTKELAVFQAIPKMAT